MDEVPVKVFCMCPSVRYWLVRPADSGRLCWTCSQPFSFTDRRPEARELADAA